MDFLQPWLAVSAIPFLILLLFLKKLERKRYADIPTQLIVKKIGRFKKSVKFAGKIIWIAAVLLIAVALGRPQSIYDATKFLVEGRKMVLSVDLSHSMSSTGYSATGRSSVNVIKNLSLEFVRKRAATDLVGITAYGGKSSGRQNGQAAVILFPTSEYAQMEASIAMLEPYMLGSYTSIGDGIFLSIISLFEYETRNEINMPALIESIEGENRDYAINLVKKIGRLQNCVIVLFTDGKNNAGIEPKYPLWLAKMLGIKVYFAALESTGATGLSEDEQKNQKELLIQGVLETGGKYYETNIIEQVNEFYNDIDKTETARLEISTFGKKEDLSFWPTMAALVLIVLGVMLETAFPRIQK